MGWLRRRRRQRRGRSFTAPFSNPAAHLLPHLTLTLRLFRILSFPLRTRSPFCDIRNPVTIVVRTLTLLRAAALVDPVRDHARHDGDKLNVLKDPIHGENARSRAPNIERYDFCFGSAMLCRIEVSAWMFSMR